MTRPYRIGESMALAEHEMLEARLLAQLEAEAAPCAPELKVEQVEPDRSHIIRALEIADLQKAARARRLANG